MVDEPAWSVAWEQLKEEAAVMHMTPADHFASFFQDEQRLPERGIWSLRASA